MSQEKPRRPQADHQEIYNQEPIKYGDVFNVSEELASKPIAPRDAAAMQSAESQVFGTAQKDGPAALMQSAAVVHQRAGHVHRNDATEVARNEGVRVMEAKDAGGNRIVTESVGGQVLGQYVKPDVPMTTPGDVLDKDTVTIGEALEATALSAAGDKPVDQSDASAIQAAQVRATGSDEIEPGSVAAEAQSAATMNARLMNDQDKTTLSDVLSNARDKLPNDKAVTREDAERVVGAEIRNKPDMSTTSGGVAASMTAAAGINQNRST